MTLCEHGKTCRKRTMNIGERRLLEVERRGAGGFHTSFVVCRWTVDGWAVDVQVDALGGEMMLDLSNSMVVAEHKLPTRRADSGNPQPIYNMPVKFTKTGQYGCGPEDEDDVYTVKEFLELCRNGALIAYDGHGYPVKNMMADPTLRIKPSGVQRIPNDATHIVWYNR